jgi:hypothetical protein
MQIMPPPNTTASVVVKNTIIVGGGHAGVNLACMLELKKKKTPDMSGGGKNSNHSNLLDDYLILEKADSLLSKWRSIKTRYTGHQYESRGKLTDRLIDRRIPSE